MMNKIDNMLFPDRYGTAWRTTMCMKRFEFLKNVELAGFKMYSLSDYAYCICTGNSDYRIVVELFSVRQTEQTIHKMELDAGYIFSEVDIADINFGIHLFETTSAGNGKVTHGYWSDFRRLSGF